MRLENDCLLGPGGNGCEHIKDEPESQHNGLTAFETVAGAEKQLESICYFQSALLLAIFPRPAARQMMADNRWYKTCAPCHTGSNKIQCPRLVMASNNIAAATRFVIGSKTYLEAHFGFNSMDRLARRSTHLCKQKPVEVMPLSPIFTLWLSPLQGPTLAG